jgi:hypothetical protein
MDACAAHAQPAACRRVDLFFLNQQQVVATMKVFNRIKSPRSGSPSKGSSKHGPKNASGAKSWKKVVDTDDEVSHRLSDLSNSTDAEDIDNIESLDDNSEDCERFERQLRYKHSKACKAMSVRQIVV